MAWQGRPILPNSKPPRPVSPFRIGQKVLMKSMPSGMPGTVQGVRRHRILVRWSDLDYVGRHRADSLMLATKEESDGRQV